MRACLFAVAVLMLIGCGDPTDRPEDCNPNQYFDEARKLCFTCPAPREPRCDDGCGIRVTSDDRGCPVAECLVGDDCSMCASTEYIDETLRCTACDGPISCPDDATPDRRISDGTCTLTCP